MPRRCPNTNCQEPFTKNCHEGYVPGSTLEVVALMRCAKCKWLWAVEQAIYMAHEYYQKLPKDAKTVPQQSAITPDEVKKHRKWLNQAKGPLEGLFEGARPDRSE